MPPPARPSRLRRLLAPLLAAFPPKKEWRAAVPAFGWALLSCMLLRFAYQPFHLSPLAFVALVPLFWGLRRCKPVMAFWVGLLFGSINGYMFTGWLTIVSRFNPFVYLGIPPLALWWGAHLAVALALIVWFGRRLAPWPALLLAMMVWAGMEYFRMIGRLGLPYGLLGHSQAGWPAMAQLASFAGVPLISALIIGVNLALMEVIAAFKARYGHAGAMTRAGTMLGLAALGLGAGSAALERMRAAYESDDAFPVRVALIQTNIDQEVKFGSYSAPPAERRELQDQMFISLLEQLDALEPGAYDLIVTPESSLTHDFVDVEQAWLERLHDGDPMGVLLRRAQELDAPLVVGGIDNVFATPDGEETDLLELGLDAATGELNAGARVYGATWMLRPQQTAVPPTADYRKVRLMPFGEEVPYLDLIPGFAENVVQIGIFDVGDYEPPVGVLVGGSATEAPREARLGFSICFEDLMPFLHRHHARGGAQLFVNTTNDAWFDRSAGPAWHADMARWRSIETHIPMLRVTNTGLTGIILPDGSWQETLPLLERTVLDTEVTVVPNPPVTLYTRIGDAFGIVCLLGSLVAVILVWRRRDDEEGSNA